MVQRLQLITVEDLFDPEKKKRPVDFPAEAVPVLGAPGIPEPIPGAEERERRPARPIPRRDAGSGAADSG
jgi:hypothetical protein